MAAPDDVDNAVMKWVPAAEIDAHCGASTCARGDQGCGTAEADRPERDQRERGAVVERELKTRLPGLKVVEAGRSRSDWYR